MIYVLYAIGIIVCFLLLLVIIALLRPSAFRIERSQLVDAAPAQLFPFINSPRRFQEWNPFKDRDPNAKNEFCGPVEGPGACFRWDGNSEAGAGSMTVTNSVADSSVEIDLVFIRPFAGRNVVEFKLTPHGPATSVSWAMTGRYALVPKILGLFLNMDRMIGSDFEKGLLRLKAIGESSEKN